MHFAGIDEDKLAIESGIGFPGAIKTVRSFQDQLNNIMIVKMAGKAVL